MSKIRLKPRRFLRNGVVEYDTDFAGGSGGSVLPFDLNQMALFHVALHDPAVEASVFHVDLIGGRAEDYFETTTENDRLTIKKKGLYVLGLTSGFGDTRSAQVNLIDAFAIQCLYLNRAYITSPDVIPLDSGTVFGPSIPAGFDDVFQVGDNISFIIAPALA